MADRELGVTIDVRRDVMMWHTVLCVGPDRAPCAVAVTNNPMDHAHFAQVVMHKTRSHQVATQVARYVRRTFGVEEPVTTHRATRPVEAMIGYACTRQLAYPPTPETPGWGTFQHIAETPVSRLLDEVAGGHSAARTRYVVYEVRSSNTPSLRGVTHRFNSLERRYREAPPDKLVNADLVQIGRFATQGEALRAAGSAMAGDHLWTRKPSVEYVRRILRTDANGDIVWACDGSSAVRRYGFDAVVIGPHVYTVHQVRGVLEHGAWPANGNSREGRRAMSRNT